MAEIFLSYTRADAKRAREIAKALRAEGFTVFYDPQIPVGDMWDWVIEQELAAAKAVVPLWSTASVNQKWLRIEANEGNNRNILAPAKLDETCKPPIACSLIESANLVGWKASAKNHPEWRNLISTLTRLAGPREAFVRPRNKERRKRHHHPDQLSLPLSGSTPVPSAESAWVHLRRSTLKGLESATATELADYRLAAHQNFAHAQYLYGLMHLFGVGAISDATEAARWLQLAANNGFHAADFALGLMFELGFGKARSARRAGPCYRRAAKRGNVAAKHALERIRQNGSLKPLTTN